MSLISDGRFRGRHGEQVIGDNALLGCVNRVLGAP